MTFHLQSQNLHNAFCVTNMLRLFRPVIRYLLNRITDYITHDVTQGQDPKGVKISAVVVCRLRQVRQMELQQCTLCFHEFDVHGPVHLGNVCSVKFPTRCTFYMYFHSSLFLALHVSGAICTHPQEYNCSFQP
jgi:hypothetical protein